MAPRRTCLSVPGGDDKKLGKARTFEVDEIILDLEDSVAPDQKPRALAAAAQALTSSCDARLSVRVNAPGSPWFESEMMTLGALSAAPRSIVLPKVCAAADVQLAEQLLNHAEGPGERAPRVRLQALIETVEGLHDVHQIAAASTRLDALILGYADLAADLGRRAPTLDSLDLWLPAQHEILLAARRLDLQAIDGPYLGTAVDEHFTAAARRARDLGFDGKWTIHPSQIEPLNALFTPDEQELEHARAVITALGEGNSALGVTTLDGQMLDEAVRRSALRTLARTNPRSQQTPDR
jgi:citrate lyase subunit beta/citryl-CoA lyase